MMLTDGVGSSSETRRDRVMLRRGRVMLSDEVGSCSQTRMMLPDGVGSCSQLSLDHAHSQGRIMRTDEFG
ncbi:hypothetical protein RRG08_003472 [Elysia crispata]|uniref:Uncharacterized protein n=1 Tax=Elysia crispata TaxID=231223 RepID=A0AAE0Y6J7_9GAST|nr:hypothetical protein RRG08_003472 [Elysia crispata]